MTFYELASHASTRAVYYYAGSNPRYRKSCIVVSRSEVQTTCNPYYVTYHLLDAGEIVDTHPGAPAPSLAVAARAIPAGYRLLDLSFIRAHAGNSTALTK